jgi:tRNA U34 5-methylaminomethyl-2-thiouridine-forming methyltransferase MnmC
MKQPIIKTQDINKLAVAGGSVQFVSNETSNDRPATLQSIEELLQSADKNQQWFNGSLGKYFILKTADGSPTLYSEHFGEACHSLAGALDETHLHYIDGCQIIEKAARKNKIKILEVGFGMGLAFLATKQLLNPLIKSKPIPTQVKYLALEMDEELVLWVKKEFSDDEILGQLALTDYFGLKAYEAFHEHFHLVILVGDARNTLADLSEKGLELMDAIYQDPFSPKRNPQMWTVEWFSLIKKWMHKDAILSTYSSSSSIRKSLLAAGLSIQNGIGFGTKKTSTRATLFEDTEQTILLKLSESPAVALYDKDYP